MPGDRVRLNSASGLIGSDVDTDSDGIWKLNEFFVKGYL